VDDDLNPVVDRPNVPKQISEGGRDDFSEHVVNNASADGVSPGKLVIELRRELVFREIVSTAGKQENIRSKLLYCPPRLPPLRGLQFVSSIYGRPVHHILQRITSPSDIPNVVPVRAR
jgi:hypothetical protein